MTDREFGDVERELEETLLKLKTTTDPKRRKTLLRRMRSLLSEADGIVKVASNRSAVA